MLNAPLPQVSSKGELAPDSLVKFFESRLQFFIKDYRQKRNKNRQCAKWLTGTTIVVAGAVTVLIAVRDSPIAIFRANAEFLGFASLVLSASLTGLGAWDAFEDYRWKWIRYRSTLSKLYAVEDEFGFGKSTNSGMTVATIEQLFARLKSAVDETNEEWTSERGKRIGDFKAGGRGGTNGPE
jgi:hypothetical protein